MLSKNVERILVAYSGHNSATFDISQYVSRGLRLIGAKVEVFRYDVEIVIAEMGCKEWSKTSETYKFNDGDAFWIASKALLSAIVTFKPDLVLVVTGIMLYGQAWEWLRQLQEDLKNPFILGLLLTESPYRVQEELQVASWANIVWTNEQAFVDSLRRINPRSYWLPHAYDPLIHYPGNGTEYEHDVYFCGSGQLSRIETIGNVDWSEIGVSLTLRGMFPDLEKHKPELIPFYEENLVPNKEVANHYRHSAINLNFHRREAERVVARLDSPRRQMVHHEGYLVNGKEATSLNNRAIEIAGCGGFQLCDNSRVELKETFGDTVPTFGSSEELTEKVVYYMAHDDECRRLANGAREAVLGRTYKTNAMNMIKQVLEVF